MMMFFIIFHFFIILIYFIITVVIAALLWWKCRQTDEGLIEEDEKEDYEVRENVMDYDEEGAGN